MRTLFSWLGALVCVGAAASLAHAGYPGYYAPQAPDACGTGYYDINQYGGMYGPNYCLRPCFEPFQGMRPNLPCNRGGMGGGMPGGMGAGMPGYPPEAGAGGIPAFPTHPFARSPRDFFMAE